MSKSLKILFYPCDAVGHVNAATGIAEVLIESGHKAVIVVGDQWKGKLEKYGIEEILIPSDSKDKAEDKDENPATKWVNIAKAANVWTQIAPVERLINFRNKLMHVEIERLKTVENPFLENALQHVKPDVIMTDNFMTIPAILKSGIPWVWWCSPNILNFIDDVRTPPGSSGLPAQGAEEEWKQFRKTVNEATFEAWSKWNDYIVSEGLPTLQNQRYCNASTFMNIYGFPAELDYTDIRPLPPNWYQFDNLKRTEKLSNFEIPEQLSHRSGKLVYFSLGSMGSADVDLMRRLVAILAKSKHRFIVSKGPLHSTYELADNMWGQESVPQIRVLPKVDLVITHGGNNTVTETFYFGKPMLVFPLFGDQWDNAQRLVEKGLGLRLDPYKCSEDELLDAIERILNDKQLNERMAAIGKRIQNDNSIGKLPKLIEDLVKK